MSDQVEFGWRVYALLASRDLEAFLEAVHPEVEFQSLIAEAEGGVYRGHEGVRRWWERVADAMGGLRFEPQAIHEYGPGVYAELVVTGTVEGVEIPQTMWQAVILRQGKVYRWAVVRSETEAREWLEQMAAA